jgi:carboxymethylenebutenolidase
MRLSPIAGRAMVPPMSVVDLDTIDVPVGTAPAKIRAVVVRPRSATARLPGVLAYSDVFQLTPPHLRLMRRLAGHGFVVISPEIYSRLEPPGTALDFDRDRDRALGDAAKVELAWIDEERRAVLDHLVARPDVVRDRIGVCGWCFGGHLAFRAAREPEVAATACFYATGVHDGNLGAAKGKADTLSRAQEIQGRLLLVWGEADPHIPRSGRIRIHRALEDAGVRFESRAYAAEHAFMRDEGPRWDPEATDRAFAAMLELFTAIRR